MSTRVPNRFVEASAGTGKTYHIVRSVVDMVEDGTPLDKILVVTYTDKATGELRRRVRLGLEKRWREAPRAAAVENLRGAIDAMDDAPIFTIHGFCQRVLGEYAFETGQPFRLQMLEGPDRSALLARLFARSLRGTWSREILRPSGDPARSAQAYNARYYCSATVEVAGRFVRGDRLEPGVPDRLPNQTETVIAALAELKPSLGATAEASPLLARVDAAKMQERSKKPVQRALAELMAHAGAIEAEPSAERISALLDWPKNDNGKKNETARKNIAILAEQGDISPAELALMKRLWTLKDAGEADLKTVAVDDLNRTYARFKQLGGGIDFNDMLLLLRDAMIRSGQIVELLRSRFHCAVVDEFQDTDQVQWEIFRRAFLESESHRLIVVGDPKQAIYSFRGANILAYTGARAGFQPASKAESLTANYRSDPALLAAFNQLFDEAGGWFDTARSGIAYRPVHSPPETTKPLRFLADGSGRATLTLVLGPDKTGGAGFRAAYAGFVAAEIAHLLKSDIEIAAERSGCPGKRRLDAGDICLLVNKHGEWPVLRRALLAAGIPCGFVRPGGLYASQEALEWRYLLRAIAAPDNPRAVMKALFTRFFDCPAGSVQTDIDRPHARARLLEEWHQLARKRQWNLVFRRILEQSGVLLRGMAGPEGDRAVTNHQHLAGLLLEQATTSGGGLPGLIEYLDQRWAREDKEENLQRLETEAPRVQVMTMHAAKGLEFPIVFIAGGFTDGHGNSDYKSYSTESGRVYSLGQDENAAALEKRERDEEARRLYYVALTRAQYKLYLPVPGVGRASSAPLNTFVKAAVESAASQGHSDWTGNVGELGIDVNGIVVDAGRIFPATRDDSDLPLWNDDFRAAPAIAPAPAVQPEWGRRVPLMRSFSSMAVHGAPSEPHYNRVDEADAVGSPETAAGRSGARLDDEGEGPVALEEPAGGATELPRGAATGRLLHEVLQDIDFAAVAAAPGFETLLESEAPSRKLIETTVGRHLPRRAAHRENDQREVARLVYAALRTPMPFLGGLELAAVPRRRHEIEFLLPAETAASAVAPGVGLKGAYLNGFIDLVFCHEGRYYLLDWKSNGQAVGDYSRQSLSAMMDAFQYDLQYKIYLLALDRMLRVAVPAYDPAAHLGGVCYLFLRGLQAGTENGIHFVPPTAFTIEGLEAEVFQRLNVGGGARG